MKRKLDAAAAMAMRARGLRLRFVAPVLLGTVSALTIASYFLVFNPSRGKAVTCLGCTQVLFAQTSVSPPPGVTGSAMTLNMWQNPLGTRTTLQWAQDGDGESTLITGTTVTTTVDGNVQSIDYYPSSTDVWNEIGKEFGVTQSTVTADTATGQLVTEPASSSASTDSLDTVEPDGTTSYSQPYSVNYHYDTSLTSLQTAVGFSVPQATSVDGYSLLGTAKSQDYGPSTDASGWFASMEYGSASDPIDSQLTVDIATPTGTASGWGDIYKSMLAATPTLTGPGYAATIVGGNQAVFQKGLTYVAVTARWDPSTTEWQTILSKLASS